MVQVKLCKCGSLAINGSMCYSCKSAVTPKDSLLPFIDWNQLDIEDQEDSLRG